MLKVVAVVLVIGACVGTAALAQDNTQNASAGAPFTPSFEQVRSVARYYPSNALDHRQSGLSDLCCSVRADRTLDCSSAREWPQGAGFGAAGVRMAHSLRLTEGSYAALQTRPNQSFEFPVVWRLEPMSADAEAQFVQAQQGWAASCGDGVAVVEPMTITGTIFGR